VFLIGRPPLEEFVDFVTSRTEGGETANLGSLVCEWTTANEHVIELEWTAAGAADNPSMSPLPAALEGLRDQDHFFVQVMLEPAYLEVQRSAATISV
jgi:hypothetical protein